jgi:hypothetical protein
LCRRVTITRQLGLQYFGFDFENRVSNWFGLGSRYWFDFGCRYLHILLLRNEVQSQKDSKPVIELRKGKNPTTYETS